MRGSVVHRVFGRIVARGAFALAALLAFYGNQASAQGSVRVLGTGKTDFEEGLDFVQPLGRTDVLLSAGYTEIGQPPGVQLDNVVRFDVGLRRRRVS